MPLAIAIASIDVGLVNFAQWCERVEISKLKKYQRQYQALPKTQRKVRNPSKALSHIIRRVCQTGKRLQSGVYNFSGGHPDPPYDLEIRSRLIAHLDSFKTLWDQIDIVVIEQQYYQPFGRASVNNNSNIKALKISETVLTWFLIHYPFKEVCLFGAKYKTEVLGAPPKLTKPQRKRWSTLKGIEILERRGDHKMIKRLQAQKKKGQKPEDQMDALNQLQAYKFLALVSETLH